MARPRAKRATMWACEGNPWTYRRPFLTRGKWRVRRRNRLDGKLEQQSLCSENSMDARAEVQEMAARERQAAEEAEKNPTEAVKPQECTIEVALLGRKVMRDGKEEREGGWIQSLDVRDRTLESYRWEAEQFSRLLGAERHVSELEFEDVERLFNAEWKDLSGRTKILRRGLLVRFFRWAIKHGFRRGNLAEGIEIAKKWSRESTRAARETGQGLTLEEARKLLDACRDRILTKHRYTNRAHAEQDTSPPGYLWGFVFLSLRTGLRMANVIPAHGKPGLLWRHLDLDKAVLDIPGELMKNDEALTVPLHREAVAVLKEKLKALGRVPAPDEPVIADVGELNRSFASAVKRAGLGDRGFRIHDLRHTFVSWLGESAPHAVMQQLAGHVARSVTDRYAKHQTIDTMRRHLDALPALLKPASARAAEGKPASKAQAQGDSRRVDGASSAPRGRRVPGAAGSRPRRPSG